MATFDSPEIVEAIIRGWYADDEPTSVVAYTNRWGGTSYGITFHNERQDRYLEASEYVQNPRLIWSIADGYKLDFKLP